MFEQYQNRLEPLYPRTETLKRLVLMALAEATRAQRLGNGLAWMRGVLWG